MFNWLRGQSRELSEAEKRIEEARKARSTALDLFGLELTEVPEAIGQLTSLQTLDLSNNQLSQLPESIAQLTSLQELYLYNNQLSQLPESIAQLTSLQELYLDNNQLSQLPEAIAQLTSLQRLDLSNNQLSQLPESTIAQLTSLQELYLHNNQLSQLPESIAQLTSLQRLYLYNNQLSQLPESIAQLTSLQRLSLDNNQLSQLPESIAQLTSLQTLYLHGNELLEIPPEILGPTRKAVRVRGETPANPQDILEYYFRTRPSVTAGPLNEAKLILVGFGAVGKTSLVNRLVSDTFNPTETKTDGIQITQWPVQLKDDTIRLNIWDFGGQEIMHSTHQFFLTERSLYLLVLNGRQGHEDEDAEYWLNLIQSFGCTDTSQSPVIIVLNKISDHAFDLNRGYLQQKFPNIKHILTTDCQDNLNIDRLKALILQETDRLENLRIRFPSEWFHIKQHLADTDQSYITYSQFQSICEDKGETKLKSIDSLAHILHQLGIALNYKDDPRLRDTHILSPHWVTNGIYKLLNDPDITAQKGLLTLPNLPQILDPKQYPQRSHSFLLSLMRKFELAFSLTDTETDYLVPDLLDKQQPDIVETFDPKTCLNFQYQYPTILPEGILPRFIVRTYPLSQSPNTPNPNRWRTGVILHRNQNRALIISDKTAKRITIRIDGPTPTRQELLAIIRHDFDYIHHSFSFQPTEKVPIPGHPDDAIDYDELQLFKKDGITTTRRKVSGKLKSLNVQDLLTGVDLPPHPTMSDRPLNLFYSYSHKDEKLRDDLETHLKLLQRQGYINPWHDRRIPPGDDWGQAIDNNLESADIILLLISVDFIASNYCHDIEMKRAMARHEAGEARVIPISLRKCDTKGTPFKDLLGLPTDFHPVTLWDDRDSAWTNVVQGIRQAIEKMAEEDDRL